MKTFDSCKISAAALVCACLFAIPTAHACSPNLPNYGNCIRQQQQMQQQIQYQMMQQQQGYGNSYNPSYSPPPLVRNVYDILVLSWTNNNRASWYRREYKTPGDASGFIYDQTAQMALESCNSDASARPCKHATWIVGDACIAYLDTPKIMYSDRGNTCQEAGEKIANRCLEYYKGNRQVCSNIQYKQTGDVPFP